MTHDEATWLVKSSGRVLGPFSGAKLAELLRSREISVLDEVSSPLRRWQTIQYHEKFKETVDSLRKATLSEHTEATWTPAGTSGLTQTLTDFSGGDLTDEISADLAGFTNTKEIVVHDVNEQPRASQPTGTARFQTSQAQNTVIERQIQKTTRSLWIATAVILLAVTAFILNKRVMTPALERPSSSDLKKTVLDAVQVGHYSEALKELKSFFDDPMKSGDLAVYYGSLAIQVEGQTVLGRRLLGKVLSARPSEAKQAHAGLGIADLIDGQLASAQTNFEKALALDPAYVPALVNLAAVFQQKGEYNRAKTTALKALEHSPKQGEALLALAEAQLYLFKVNAKTAELEQVGKRVRAYLRDGWDYHPELRLYDLYFDFLKKQRGLEAKIQDFLNNDPNLTMDHRHNVFIFKGRTQWKVLARFCEQIAAQLGDGPRIATFLGACHAHEERWDASRRNIEKAVNQAPKDPLVQAWYSHILKESGDPEQASVVLGRANELNRRGEYILPVLLQARFCQLNGDVDCARSAWTRVYEQDYEYLPAVGGLAWAGVQRKATSESLKLIDKGLSISPDYIPLLVLRQRAEREGWYAKN